MPPQCCMDVKEQYRGRPSVSRSRPGTPPGQLLLAGYIRAEVC